MAEFELMWRICPRNSEIGVQIGNSLGEFDRGQQNSRNRAGFADGSVDFRPTQVIYSGYWWMTFRIKRCHVIHFSQFFLETDHNCAKPTLISLINFGFRRNLSLTV
ncbi:MAG: hypothetical protein KDD92_01495 [Caldilineaceae bacterium]|nr:hypothetical protein [Caldilineaceae bacterium]